MPNEISIRRGSEWVISDDIFVRNAANTEWKQVIAVLTWTDLPARDGRYHWETMFEYVQEPPVGLRGVVTDPHNHSVAELAWDPDPTGLATHYRVVMRTAGTSVVDYRPSPPEWTEELHYEWPGLKPDNEYTFTVQAMRMTVDGFEIISKESSSKTLWTGHPTPEHQQSPGYPTPVTAYVSASKSDTWDNHTTAKWRGGGSVVQGYAPSQVGAQNAYGCVSYSTMRSQLDTKYGATVADHIEVTDVKINRIYRNNGGTGNPTVAMYACLVNFASKTRPAPVGTSSTFAAPDELKVKDNFDLTDTNKLRDWVQAWVDKTTLHNGLLIFRTGGTGNETAGYNGFCSLRKANYTASEWRLVLSIRWSFQAGEYQAPVWS